jgi:hypothetical protein
MGWNEKATDYLLGEDLKIRSPTNEEVASNPCGKDNAILAVVTGTHFVPAGLSRNKRYYPESAPYGFLWGEQLKKPWIVEKMANNTMCGTIGHDTEIGEKEFREGKVSHFTKALKIIPTGDPNKPYKGYAESYVLNTPAGQALKTYLDAGMKLYVSSRAGGDFLPGVTYKVAEDGSEVPVLDPSKFKLERFDFVFNPGFFDAHPTLKENMGINESLLKSMNEAYMECEKYISENSIKETNMGGAMGNELINKSAGDVVIQVSDDNKISISKAKAVGSTAQGTDSPHGKVATATKDTDKDGAAEVDFDGKGQNTLTEKLVADLMARNEELKRELATLKESVASDATPDINDMTKDMLAKNLKKIDPQGIVGDGGDAGHGSRDELIAALKKVEDFNENVGSPQEIVETLVEIRNLFEACGGVGAIVEDMLFHEQYGSTDEIAATIDAFHEFSNRVGTPDRILGTLRHCEEVFTELGDPDDITDFVGLVDKFCERYGSLEEIAQKLDAVEEFFRDCGSPSEIRESMAMAEELGRRIKRFQELGVGNVAEMKTVLEELQETRLKNTAHAIAEHTGINSDRVEEHLRKGMTERQIVEMYNKSADNYYGKFLTVREDVSGTQLDKIPLKTVDKDGNHVQLSNASFIVDTNANASVLEMALAGITNRRL